MRLLFATCSPDAAESLLLTLLNEGLVGCGNLIPGVRSHYWWQGELCCDEEVVMLMETTEALASAAAARLKQLHPYDVPKIITLDPSDCDADYLTWLTSNTRPIGSKSS